MRGFGPLVGNACCGVSTAGAGRAEQQHGQRLGFVERPRHCIPSRQSILVGRRSVSISSLRWVMNAFVAGRTSKHSPSSTKIEVRRNYLRCRVGVVYDTPDPTAPFNRLAPDRRPVAS